jgi:hypothetical protein
MVQFHRMTVSFAQIPTFVQVDVKDIEPVFAKMHNAQVDTYPSMIIGKDTI